MAAPKTVHVLNGHSTDGKSRTTWHVAAFLDRSGASSAASTLKMLNRIGETATLKAHDPGAFLPDTDTVRPNVTYSAHEVKYSPVISFDSDGDALEG